ncbi:hypothetical protein GGH96_005709 [Coemansia sp. RSA 1972]|nr:hypothetical protein GGH96_005709 [Coemansia sp. RSA 1972]
MGFKLSKELDSQVSTGAGATKRLRVEDYLAPVYPDRSAVQHDHTAPPLPAGFPAPPAGHEVTFATWARCWRQLHGDAEVTIEFQLEIGRFVRTIKNLPRHIDDKENAASPSIVAIRARLDQANNNLKAAIDLGDISDIQSKVTIFQIISQAYQNIRAAHCANYTSQLEAAVDRVERLLICKAEPAATAESTSMIGAPTHRMLLEQQLNYVGPNAGPTIRFFPEQEFSDADSIHSPVYET